MEKLGPIARIVKATLRDTANPTMLKAGYKANVVPATAEAVVDCRVLPGRLAAFEAEVDEPVELLGDVHASSLTLSCRAAKYGSDQRPRAPRVPRARPPGQLRR